MITESIALSDLCDGLIGLSSGWGKVLAEAGAVCLEEKEHSAGVSLRILGLSRQQVELHWSPTDDQIRRSHNDLQEATEFGACGIAILLVLALTEFTVIRRSRKGTGFDYWLGRKDDPLFQEAARLEVSGIMEGGSSVLDRRVRQKVRQTQVSNGRLPAYIVVVEFGDPKSKVEQS